MGRGALTGGEKAVDDLGEAHAIEVRGDGDGGGRRMKWGRQLCDEAHAHLARGIRVHGCGCGVGAREEGEGRGGQVVVVVVVGVAAAGSPEGSQAHARNNSWTRPAPPGPDGGGARPWLSSSSPPNRGVPLGKTRGGERREEERGREKKYPDM